MKTHGWFGQSWGAPCCEPEDHVPTPIGRPCLRCREPIREGDQGLVQPLLALGEVSIEPLHIECFLRSVRPHGPECPYCRGAERIDHDAECAYRKAGGVCSCREMPSG